MAIGRVLILGANGMVGRAWCGLLAAHGVGFDFGGRELLDLEDLDAVSRLDVSSYSHVVNCGAWTAVDEAEAQEARAHRVNAEAVGVLAKRCGAAGARLVTYSTDYVFRGEATAPYPVDGEHDPVNAYGRSKAAGEALLGETGGGWLCIRTSWVYAPWGKNFVRTIAGAAKSRPELRVVHDQRGRPTSAEGLARTSLGLMLRGAAGMWHASDGGECTWFEFASEIVRLTGAACRVAPCTSAEFPRPAARPSYSVLDLGATERAVGEMTPWAAALGDVVRRLGAAERG
ncbi:MAG: dTDP-4-dehydrorhamnose reductase [Phycisphaerales bacterium]|nr:dTDP-4-dehydrorhamnose reductase [Phycisphaerales bacterium]